MAAIPADQPPGQPDLSIRSPAGRPPRRRQHPRRTRKSPRWRRLLRPTSSATTPLPERHITTRHYTTTPAPQSHHHIKRAAHNVGGPFLYSILFSNFCCLQNGSATSISVYTTRPSSPATQTLHTIPYISERPFVHLLRSFQSPGSDSGQRYLSPTG